MDGKMDALSTELGQVCMGMSALEVENQSYQEQNQSYQEQNSALVARQVQIHQALQAEQQSRCLSSDDIRTITEHLIAGLNVNARSSSSTPSNYAKNSHGNTNQ